MNETTTRLAGLGDEAFLVESALRLAERENQVLDVETLRRGIRALLADPDKGRFLIAEADDRPVGQLMLTREWSEWRCGWHWWILSVYTVPEMRRQGVFRALHSEVLRLAKVAGDVCSVRLYVHQNNAVALAVYTKSGMLNGGYQVFSQTLGF